MSAPTESGQLELFEIGASQARPRQPSIGLWCLQLRHDQAMIAAIAGLIGLTVVFALGVERGKELVRGERALWQRAEVGTPGAASPAAVVAPAKAAASVALPVKAAPEESQAKQSPAAAPRPVAPKETVASRTRYAVQAATYSRMPIAQREMQRLHQTGERAFLVQREGRTVLYVGPFPSEILAREKLPQLRDRYGDCFIKSL